MMKKIKNDDLVLNIETNKALWIMNANGANLTSMIAGFMQEVDNYTQIAGDNDNDELATELQNDYIKLEEFYILSKINQTMRKSDRNEVRQIFKSAIKQIGAYIN
jgi:hypothetical protein